MVVHVSLIGHPYVDGAALRGWRMKAFGEDALKLCDGKLALRANGHRVDVFEV